MSEFNNENGGGAPAAPGPAPTPTEPAAPAPQTIRARPINEALSPAEQHLLRDAAKNAPKDFGAGIKAAWEQINAAQANAPTTMVDQSKPAPVQGTPYPQAPAEVQGVNFDNLDLTNSEQRSQVDHALAEATNGALTVGQVEGISQAIDLMPSKLENLWLESEQNPEVFGQKLTEVIEQGDDRVRETVYGGSADAFKAGMAEISSALDNIGASNELRAQINESLVLSDVRGHTQMLALARVVNKRTAHAAD